MMPSMIKQKWWVASVTIGFIRFEKTTLSRNMMAFKKLFFTTEFRYFKKSSLIHQNNLITKYNITKLNILQKYRKILADTILSEQGCKFEKKGC